MLLSQVNANGGIQRFNRTLLTACEQLQLDCDVHSLADSVASPSSALDSGHVRLTGYGFRKLHFAAAVAKALWSGRYRTVVVGHIRLLGLCAALSVCNPWSKARLVLITHGTEVWTGIGGWRRWALRATERILCVSSYTRRRVLAQAPELDPRRLIVFPNALSDSWVQRQGDLTATQGEGPLQLPERFILSVGRLTKHDRTKGIVTAIEALPALPADVHLVVAGGGDDADFLRVAASRLHVEERVHLLGAVTDQQLAHLYRNCRAFVLPSSQEGFGIVFIEAMFFGAVVIAAREKGAVDVVRHEETGLLVEYGNSAAVAAAVMRVLSDSVLRERLQRAATATVTKQGAYTFAAFTARTAVVLDLDGLVPTASPLVGVAVYSGLAREE